MYSESPSHVWKIYSLHETILSALVFTQDIIISLLLLVPDMVK
jgi:hypothetical protein